MRRAALLLGAVLLGPALLRGGDASRRVLTPAIHPSPLRRPWAAQATVFSRQEIVLNLETGVAPVRRMETTVRGLFSNITVPTLGNRIRYSFYEAEGEAKALLRDGRRGGGPSLAAAAFLNRFWLQADDGVGATRALRRTFLGAQALADLPPVGPLGAGLALRGMRSLEDRKTVVSAGPALGWRFSDRWSAAAEGHFFLRDPLDYNMPWGWSLKWTPDAGLSTAFTVSNTYGVTSPDTFAASRFPQYQLRWTYQY